MSASGVSTEVSVSIEVRLRGALVLGDFDNVSTKLVDLNTNLSIRTTDDAMVTRLCHVVIQNIYCTFNA